MESQSNVGKWNNWYRSENIGKISYGGDAITYLMAASFFADLGEVEDWGCGVGGFKNYCTTKYIGVDGSNTPFADKMRDLTTYRSETDGIMLRHVLEHNYDWQKILTNALSSFKKKMFLCLFTPFAETTTEIAYTEAVGVPDLSMSKAEIESNFTDIKWCLLENIETATQYGVEHVYLLWR